MSSKVLWSIVAVIALSFLAFKTFGDSDRIAKAKAQVATQLKDPASAQFKDVEDVGGRVCGQVNARNAFGGYTGFFQFYVKGDEVLLAEPGPDPEALLQKARVSGKCIEYIMEDANNGVAAAEAK